MYNDNASQTIHISLHDEHSNDPTFAFLAKSCGGVLSDAQGNFNSPHYPSFYPPALDCKWTIEVGGPAP